MIPLLKLLIKIANDTYGQTDCPLPPEQIQSIMEWLFASLLNAEYVGRSHLIWDLGDQEWRQVALTALLKDQPLLSIVVMMNFRQHQSIVFGD